MPGLPRKRVLLLGAGMVADPFIHYFSLEPNVQLTVASRSAISEQRLATATGAGKGHGNVEYVVVDASKEMDKVEKLIGESNLVVSLLPYVMHTAIARMCIKHKVDMATSSYLSAELQAMEKEVKAAGITVMNEAGLDPGIDHMLAMECIDGIHARGGKVTSFVSFCGGLPAPESSRDNPLRYKFSWSPKGMLLALLNPAQYLKDGRVVKINGGGAVLDKLFPIEFMPEFELAGYANRDSTPYAEIYGVAGEVETLLRGMLRYTGFPETVRALIAVGYLSTETKKFLDPAHSSDMTWHAITASLIGQNPTSPLNTLRQAVTERIADDNNICVRDRVLGALEQLGLLSANKPTLHHTPIDTLAAHLAKTLTFSADERDLVVLNHDIEASYPHPNPRRELHRVSLVAYGEPNGYSAMARTVGYTCAIVAHMVLEGKVQEKGLLRPVAKEVYEPMLKRLEEFGIKAVEEVKRID